MTGSLPLLFGVSKPTSKASTSTATSSGLSIEVTNDATAIPDLRGLLEKYDVGADSSRPLSIPAALQVVNEVTPKSQQLLLDLKGADLSPLSFDGDVVSSRSLERLVDPADRPSLPIRGDDSKNVGIVQSDFQSLHKCQLETEAPIKSDSSLKDTHGSVTTSENVENLHSKTANTHSAQPKPDDVDNPTIAAELPTTHSMLESRDAENGVVSIEQSTVAIPKVLETTNANDKTPTDGSLPYPPSNALNASPKTIPGVLKDIHGLSNTAISGEPENSETRSSGIIDDGHKQDPENGEPENPEIIDAEIKEKSEKGESENLEIMHAEIKEKSENGETKNSVIIDSTTKDNFELSELDALKIIDGESKESLRGPESENLEIIVGETKADLENTKSESAEGTETDFSKKPEITELVAQNKLETTESETQRENENTEFKTHENTEPEIPLSPNSPHNTSLPASFLGSPGAPISLTEGEDGQLILAPAIPSSPTPLTFKPIADFFASSSPTSNPLKPMSDLASPTEQEYSVGIDRLPDLNLPELDSGAGRSRRSSADPTQQYRELHKPFSFPSFVAQLANKDAAPIARYIRSFLVAFWKQGHTFTAEQRVKVVKDFEIFIHEKFALHEPFASMDALDLENSREGLEKLVMNRVHGLCFPSVVAADGAAVPKAYARDLEADKQFADQLDKYSWVNGGHLDVADLESQEPRLGPTLRDGAAAELNKMNKYKAPRDKIICILNACKLIVLALRKQLHSTNADAFIPLLILVIFKAKCDHLISNMHYIESFRGEEWLGHGETSYYLASLQGAISFIQGLDETSLTISLHEYHAHMEAWDAQALQSQASESTYRAPEKIVARGHRASQNDNNLAAEPQHTPKPTQIHNVQPYRPFGEDAPSGLSPSNVILSSAEMLTKSISDFLTPSPPIRSPENLVGPDPTPAADPTFPNTDDPSRTHLTTYRSLREMFPTIDRDIIKDILFMHNGEIGACVDGCLQLTAED